MKISLLTLGTRGDIQPYIALGKALTARGHKVLLAGPQNFGDWVESHGLVFRSLGADMESFLQSAEARRALAGSPWSMIKLWRQTIVPLTRQTLYATWEAARDSDVIVYHPKAAGATDVAEANGAALVYAAPFPIFPTEAFPFCVFPGNYGPWLNRLSYKLLVLPRLFFFGVVTRWRREILGLGRGTLFSSVGASSGDPVTQICAVSPAIVPYASQQESGVYTTGYWFLEEGNTWQPDAKLARFLKAGPPPVYIGFGSMPSKNPARLSRQVLEGVGRAGVRAILATGWGGLQQLETPDTVHVIESAPHDALFKQVGAVVHHGGSGTTAAGLKAGKPTLVCYSSFDQPYWGRRIFNLGLGPKPQALKRLVAERFAAGLKELVGNESFKKSASEMAQVIAAEDGLVSAVDIIQGLRPRRRRAY
jgi:sterol 3beta-glucosyltransferase